MTDAPLSQFISGLIPKPKLQIHVSDTLEAGYSQYGPTLNLEGVLTALSKVALVEDIKIQLSLENATDSHTFSWLAFLPHEFDLDRMRDFEFKPPSKFMIAPKQAHNFNILFADHEHYAEMNPSIKRIKTGWRNTFQNIGADQNINFLELFEKYKLSSDAQSNVEKLRGLCFWEEGQYFLTLIISLRKPNQIFEVKRSFFLPREDVGHLKKNAEIILADLCKLPGINYFYSKLKLSPLPAKK